MGEAERAAARKKSPVSRLLVVLVGRRFNSQGLYSLSRICFDSRILHSPLTLADFLTSPIDITSLFGFRRMHLPWEDPPVSFKGNGASTDVCHRRTICRF